MQALLASALLVAAGPLAAFGQTVVPTPKANTTTTSCKSLTQFITATPDLSSIGALLDDAGVLSQLNDYGANLTLFLPNNAAFEDNGLTTDLFPSIDSTTLAAVLQTHVVLEKVSVKNVTASKPLVLQSLESDEACLGVLTVANVKGTFDVSTQIDNATVVAADVPICNGLVQVIDNILVPCESALNSLIALLNSTELAPAPAPSVANKTKTPTPTPTKTPTPSPTPSPSVTLINSIAPAPTATAAPVNRSVNAPAPSAAGTTMVQATLAAMALLAAVFVL